MTGREDASDPAGYRFVEVVRQHVAPLYEHCRLMYPLTDPRRTTLLALSELRTEWLDSDVDVRLHLLRCVRQIVYAAEDDVDVARRRNCDGIVLALSDQYGWPDDDRPSHELAVFAELSVAEQELVRLHTCENLDVEQMAFVLDADVDDVERTFATAVAAISATTVSGREPIGEEVHDDDAE